MRKQCIHFFSAVLDLILFILAGNDNIVHESLDGFEICLDLTAGFHGNIKGLKIEDFTFSCLLFI